MKKAIIYIHGKGGTAAEAAHYKLLFPTYDVIGFDYSAATPWEAKCEFPPFFDRLCETYDTISILANSIGAFFAMHALNGKPIETAYFISPIVDLEKLIADMMAWAGVTQDTLREKKRIETQFGETLSWEYLRYVRANPILWDVPTHILYGENDAMTSFETISQFARRVGASLAVMPGGEHWFHTEAQMRFLDGWIIQFGGETACEPSNSLL